MPVFSRFTRWSVLICAVFLFIFNFSETAHAGLISFVSSLLSSEQASAEVNSSSTSLNTQNIPILQPAINQDPNPEKLSDIVPVDGDDTLIADLASNNSTSTDTSNMQISTYAVREGDTISSVAKMFKVSVNTILWANDLTSKSTLKAGQILVILPISGISYTIKKGDTVKSIAAHYKTDESDIVSYNDLTVSSLQIGHTIIIPDAAPDTQLPASHKVSVSGLLGSVCVPYEPLLDNVSKLPSYPGYYSNPVPGGVKTQCLHGHNAIDLAAPVGTPIIASAAGTVIIDKMNDGWNGGYGNYVVVSHPNGTQTLYGHMSRGAVEIGQKVTKGETLGYIGMTGMTTGPHVHFEIRGARNPF